MTYLLSTGSINGMNLYVIDIKVYFYPYLIFYLSHEYFNILKNILFIKKLDVGQLITLNKSVIIWQKSLTIIISV